jgi:hypothetical protein
MQDPNLYKSVTQLKEEEEDATNETEEQALSRMRSVLCEISCKFR